MEQSTELQAQPEAFLDASGSANAGVVAGEFYFGATQLPLPGCSPFSNCRCCGRGRSRRRSCYLLWLLLLLPLIVYAHQSSVRFICFAHVCL